MRAFRQGLLIASLAIAPACSSAGGGSGDALPPTPRQDRNLILQDELQRTAVSDLFEAIRNLRPQWLRQSPTVLRQGGEGSILVYLDGVRYGDPSSLRQISVNIVQEVRYLSASEAQARYGTMDLHGVIAVTTRHR